MAILFVTEPTRLGAERIISSLFIVAMVLLIAGLVLFLQEIRLAMKSLRNLSNWKLHEGPDGNTPPEF